MNFRVPLPAFRLAWLLNVLPLLLLTGVVLLAAPRAEASDTFSATGAMSAARSGHTATRLPDVRVLVAGGLNGGGTLGSAELYDPGTGVWTATGSLLTARSGHTAVLLQNGKVLVTGGRSAGGAALASAELYDPATGTWTATGAMQTARRHHTATLLKDGRVLVAGGSADDDGTVSFDTSELYNPATGAWTETGLLNSPRSFHTAALLRDNVYIFGGVSGGVFFTSIEVYNTERESWGFADLFHFPFNIVLIGLDDMNVKTG